MSPIPLGFWAAAGTGAAAGAYELISTTILSADTASVSFDISAYTNTYKHLQIRYLGRNIQAVRDGQMIMRFNGDASASYSRHYLMGTGSSAVSSADINQVYATFAAGINGASANSGVFTPGIIDIIDFASTAKNKTVRAFHGSTDGAHIALESNLWRSTSAITNIYMAPQVNSFATGCRFSLYGIKG